MSASSTVLSFFSYFQNLGATISLPSIHLPDDVERVIDTLRNFMVTLKALIPSLPQFDIRLSLAILSLGFPLILDVFFAWFIKSFISSLFHLFDLIAIFVVFMYLARGVYADNWQFAIIVPLGVYILVRLFIIFIRRHKESIFTITSSVCAHFMNGIIPGVSSQLSFGALNLHLKYFSEAVQIKPAPPSCGKSFLRFIFFAIFFVFGLFASDLIPFGYFSYLPTICQSFLAPLLFTIAALLLLSFLLNLTNCGRNFIMKFQNFLKRWGLRFLMLLLDMLYIPILTLFIATFMVTKSESCPDEYFRYYDFTNISSGLYNYITIPSRCVPCNSNFYSNSKTCPSLCHSSPQFLLQDDPSLEFHEDIFKPMICFYIYIILVIMIGIPSVWLYIIKTNIKYARVINVFGQAPSEKWIRLLNRLKTTGMFLFVNYKYSNSTWSVFYIFVKFIVMIITSISSHIFSKLTFVLPAFYIIIFLAISIVRPYLYSFNNILDSILYLSQFIYSLLPVISLAGVVIPTTVLTVLTIAISIIPIISIIFLFFCKKKKVDFENDPTVIHQLDEEEEAHLELKRRRAKRKLKKRIQVVQTLQEEIGEASQNAQSNEKKEDNEENDEEQIDFENLLHELDHNENICLIPEDKYEVQPGELDSIEQMLDRMIQKRLKNRSDSSESLDSENAEATYTVNKRVLANRMTKMYEIIDIVVDGSTIEFLTSILNYGILIGIAALGWYFGALLDHDMTDKMIICGEI